MNNTSTQLSRRATASPHWKWLPGMRAEGIITDPSLFGSPTARSQFVVVDVLPTGIPLCRWNSQPIQEALPVLTDPATLGALLSLVRKVKANEHYLLSTVNLGHQGRRWVSGTYEEGMDQTEGEALVTALESI